MRRAEICFILGAALLLCVALPSFGQQNNPAEEPPQSSHDQVQFGLLSRWFDMQSGEISIRSKLFTPGTIPAGPWTNQIQYSATFNWSFKFDPSGKYKVNFSAATGRGFVGSWNHTGIGPDDRVGKFFMRQLNFAATPLPGVEMQYGGLGFVRGNWTSITDFSANGFLVGERVRIKRPEMFFFDEISLSGGALKDVGNPDVFNRFRRLDEFNYFQFIVTKSVGKNVRLSGGYDSYDGVDLLHQAVEIKFKNLPLADTVLFENYLRLNNSPAWGFGLTFEKTLFSHWSLNGGLSCVDRYFVPLNSERLGRGNHVFLMSTYPIWSELSFFVSGTKAFNNDSPLSFNQRLDVGFTYNVQEALKRAHLF